MDLMAAVLYAVDIFLGVVLSLGVACLLVVAVFVLIGVL